MIRQNIFFVPVGIIRQRVVSGWSRTRPVHAPAPEEIASVRPLLQRASYQISQRDSTIKAVRSLIVLRVLLFAVTNVTNASICLLFALVEVTMALFEVTNASICLMFALVEVTNASI
jgi:hypothetical protein